MPRPDALHEPPQHTPAVIGNRRILSCEFADIEAEPKQHEHGRNADKEGRPGVSAN
jgi:hypothetical protein